MGRSNYPAFKTITAWLEKIDPGTHRRIKGLRLVTAYALAAMMGTMADIARGVPDRAALPTLAGSFALWASVSEGRATRVESSRDLALLSGSAALGAISFILFEPSLTRLGLWGPELTLVSGAFLVSYLRRFGLTEAGIGSQIFIGQLLAYTASLTASDWPTVVDAGLLAALASVVPRVLSGPAEKPPPPPMRMVSVDAVAPELAMGFQAVAASLVVVVANAAIGLMESAWAITASTYVIAGSASGTLERGWRRIIGTMIGVSLDLCCLPLTNACPLAVWAFAALAMMIYAIALPQRYDVACAAYAFVLVVTLAISGVHSVTLLASRAWETVLGGALGIAAATFLFRIRPPQPIDHHESSL